MEEHRPLEPSCHAQVRSKAVECSEELAGSRSDRGPENYKEKIATLNTAHM